MSKVVIRASHCSNRSCEACARVQLCLAWEPKPEGSGHDGDFEVLHAQGEPTFNCCHTPFGITLILTFKGQRGSIDYGS